jgi:RNA ligase (TIGR02306 family)
MKGKQFYSTYKVDGSSATIYYYKKGSEDFFGCCSKNLEKREDDRNEIWKIAYKYDLKNIFNKLGKDLAIQFEVAGIGNKNKVGLSEVSPFLFNIYDISERRYLGVDDVIKFSKDYNFPMAWIQDYDKTFDFKNDEELRRYAEGHYPTGKTREGVVIRPMVETSIRGQRVSFKVINLLYKFN